MVNFSDFGIEKSNETIILIMIKIITIPEMEMIIFLQK